MRSSAMRSVMSCAPHRLARGVATVARRARRAAKKGQTRWSGLVNFSAGALDRIRTCGFLLRRQTLYPLSYKGTAGHIIRHHGGNGETNRRSSRPAEQGPRGGERSRRNDGDVGGFGPGRTSNRTPDPTYFWRAISAVVRPLRLCRQVGRNRLDSLSFLGNKRIDSSLNRYFPRRRPTVELNGPRNLRNRDDSVHSRLTCISKRVCKVAACRRPSGFPGGPATRRRSGSRRDRRRRPRTSCGSRSAR